MDKFTRKQLHEYFSDRYQPEQINQALFILAENGADVDPNGSEFSLDITDELERIFKEIGAAIDKQKALGSSDETMMVMAASQAVSQFSRHSSPQLIAAMIRLITEEAIAEAAALTQLKSHVMEKVLRQGDTAIAQSIMNRSRSTIEYVQGLVGDSDRLNKLTAQYGVETVDVDKFLAEARLEPVKLSMKAMSSTTLSGNAPQQNEVDIDAFLLEAGI